MGNVDRHLPAERPYEWAPIHICKAGVRGSIPLVSTTLTSGISLSRRPPFDQLQPPWHPVFCSDGTSRCQPSPARAIRRRGRSYQVIVYAALDPLTGRKLYLRESTTNEAEAQRILRRLTAQVDEQRHAKTNASFRTAIEGMAADARGRGDDPGEL
jgi:hypothetical protein